MALYDFGVLEEQARSWRLLSERLAAETDERIRSNLEVVARHVAAEVGAHPGADGHPCPGAGV